MKSARAYVIPQGPQNMISLFGLPIHTDFAPAPQEYPSSIHRLTFCSPLVHLELFSIPFAARDPGYNGEQFTTSTNSAATHAHAIVHVDIHLDLHVDW